MVIITKTTLDEYAQEHSTIVEPLNDWYKETKKADWSNFHDIKKTFNSVDGVGNDRYVFNIKGNDYRLITLIIFRVRTIFILWLGTHAEYDKLNKTIGAGNIEYKN